MKKLIFLIILLFSTVCHAKMDVVFAIDNNYPLYTMLMINSIMKNNASKQDYTFWVLETDVTNENKTRMKNYVESVGQKINFITIDPKYIEKWSRLYNDHITPIAMSRILIPELLPKDIDKALYLDSDMLVAEDIKTLFDEDLEDYYVGMVPDKLYRRFQYADEEGFKYMNAGVILFNLPKWRAENLSEKMLDYVDANAEKFACSRGPFWQKKDCYFYKDQDLIYFFLRKKTKEISGRWNNQILRKAQKINEPMGIYHYIGKPHRKPWNSQETPAQKLYRQYWAESPFASEMP